MHIVGAIGQAWQSKSSNRALTRIHVHVLVMTAAHLCRVQVACAWQPLHSCPAWCYHLVTIFLLPSTNHPVVIPDAGPIAILFHSREASASWLCSEQIPARQSLASEPWPKTLEICKCTHNCCSKAPGTSMTLLEPALFYPEYQACMEKQWHHDLP